MAHTDVLQSHKVSVSETTRSAGQSRRRRRFVALSLSVLTAVAITLLTGVQPAAADTPVTAYGGAGLAVTVNTGAKNYDNHTQWVSSLYVLDSGGQICDPADPTEAWAGSAWYTRDTNCQRGELFSVNSWVPSGSGVCGSYYRWMSFPGTFPWSAPNYGRFRFIACITITV